MSYVIQNFYYWNNYYIMTPRFKFYFFLLNLEKFFIFLKFNFFFFFLASANNYNLQLFNLFFQFFFGKQYFKILFNLNLNFVGNYANNHIKSSIFWIYTHTIRFIDKKFQQTNINLLLPHDEHFFNLYFYPIKAADVKMDKYFCKKLFYYFMLIWPFLWYQWSNSIKFYLNFMLITYHFQISRFYNNYFLKIYNY